MKEFIRETLRENSGLNMLNKKVTRPTQELIVMRGIPGAGKSTKSKSLVGQGKIHSTDDLIEKSGDYNEFFAKMIADTTSDDETIRAKAFLPLSQMHSQNLKDAIASLKAGVSPVIIDNTNIKMNEPKAIIMAALEMGLADNNIKFVDIGTAGLEAADLAARNSHGVPLEKIQQMIASHTGQGEMTLRKVLDAKDMYKQSDVEYSCVLLDKASHNKLLTPSNYNVEPPDGWRIYAHHMTINLGPLKDKSQLGKEVDLTVTHVGLSDMAMAFRVEGYPTTNKIPHITLAVSPEGKPVMSNDITKWQPIKQFIVKGVVSEIKK